MQVGKLYWMFVYSIILIYYRKYFDILNKCINIHTEIWRILVHINIVLIIGKQNCKF